ncbi:MAG: MCE family protein [Bdellovibrionales bacterium]|nr:MCE family protein [Bdellovibrionales bacterium]
MATGAEKKVGMFVIIGFIALVVVVFVIGGNRSLFSSTYELKVYFKQVQGISKGSVVQLVGLPIGNVSRIEFQDDSYQLAVIMEINTKFKDRITAGSTAGVRTQGALGDKFIFITPGPQENEPIANNGVLDPEQGGDLFSTLSEKGSNISEIFEIITGLKNMVKDLNGNNEMKDIITNLKSTTQELKTFTNDLNTNRSGQEIRQTISKLHQIIAKIENGSGTLGAIINDPTLYKKLQQLAGPQNVSPIKSAIRESIKETEN